MTAVFAVFMAATVSWAATDYSATIRDLSPYITNQLQATGASSLTLILIDSNQVVWSAGFGLADPIAGHAADADTVYGIASVSKTFTALAAMRQVDRGQLNLDAPVINYVPTFAFHPRFPDAAPITPRRLMNHQSGLPGSYAPYAETTVPDLRFGVEVLEGLADEYPIYPPDFSDTYNNNGFTLMESVVAALSEKTFVAQMAADVFLPLGMTNTGFQLITNQFNGKLARSMIGTNAYPDDIVNVHASGGIYSSANDMGRVIEMLLGGGEIQGQRFMSTNALAAMLTFQGTNVAVASSDPDTRNGLGWDNVADPKLAYAGRACFKGGDTAYFHSHLEIMPERGLGVAVLCNGGALAQNVAQQALMLAVRDKWGISLPTNSAPFPDSPVTNTPPLSWEQIAGYYAREGGVVRVTTDNQTLTLYVNAFDPTVFVYTNLAPHVNGWFWEAGNTNVQVAFSNVPGHLLLMSRNNKGQYWNTKMIGERIVPTPVSAAWSNRTRSVWINADLDPFNFDWVIDAVKPVELSVSNGFLFFNTVAFAPTNDSLAFPFIAGRNDAGTLKVVSTNGEEWLRLMGSHYCSVDLLPVLAAPGVTNAVLVGDTIGWYRIARSGSGWLELNMKAAPMPQLRVLNAGFSLMETLQPVAGRFLVAPTGTVYVAVAHGLNGGDAYALHAFWRRVASDYDGDGKADPAVYSAAGAVWGVALSSSGYIQIGALTLGGPSMTTVDEDYDGDGRMDPAVFDPTTVTYWVMASGSGYRKVSLSLATPQIVGVKSQWAAVPADYDGDGKADPACYRATDGMWVIACSGSGYATALVNGFGGSVWTPVAADYDGDGMTDPACYRAADGIWAIACSGSGYATTLVNGFGGSAWTPVAADYDGDGMTDPACYRAADGMWAVALSGSGYATALVSGCGGSAWTPVVADYDGDGKADPACYRAADGIWQVLVSRSGYAMRTLTFGGPGYTPAR